MEEASRTLRHQLFSSLDKLTGHRGQWGGQQAQSQGAWGPSPVFPSPASTAITHCLSPGLSRGGGTLLPGSSTAHTSPLNLICPLLASQDLWIKSHVLTVAHTDGETCLLLCLTSCLNPFATDSPGCFTSSNMPCSFLSLHLLFPPLEPPDLCVLGLFSSLRPQVRGHLSCRPVCESPLIPTSLFWIPIFSFCQSESSSHSWCSYCQAPGKRFSVCLI